MKNVEELLVDHLALICKYCEIKDKLDFTIIQPIITNQYFDEIQRRLEKLDLFNDFDMGLGGDEYLSRRIRAHLPTSPRSAVIARVSQLAPVYYTYTRSGDCLNPFTYEKRGEKYVEVPLEDPDKDKRRPFDERDLQKAVIAFHSVMASMAFMAYPKEVFQTTIGNHADIPESLQSLTFEDVFFDAFNKSEYGSLGMKVAPNYDPV